MILLDTDHLSVLQVPSSDRRTHLVARLALAGDEVVGTTIVSVEEQTKGWLAAIARERQSGRQVRAYRGLSDLFGFFRPFHIAQFDERPPTYSTPSTHCVSAEHLRRISDDRTYPC